MKSPSRAAFILLALAAFGIGLAIHGDQRTKIPRTSEPMPQQAYVWQRVWDGRAQSAAVEHGTNFDSLVILAAEITWENRRPQMVRVDLDFAALRAANTPAGLALRIGPFSGPFSADDEICRRLGDMSESIVRSARTNDLALQELQIDFDCAESKLDGYRLWIASIRQRIAPIPLTITTLPAWLKRREFAALARATDGFVLQVHSLDRPRGPTAPFTLCEPADALRWVDQAARLGVPFRVALPTYGYELSFDASGQFLGLNAEGPRRIFPATTFLREARADPGQMAALVRTWSTSRPTAMLGAIWYRLPVPGDRLNWSWTTMSEVIAGRAPESELKVRARTQSGALTEITLANEGRADFVGLPSVQAHWADGRLIAADGLAEFGVAEKSAFAVELRIDHPIRLAPGEHRQIGWMRLDKECEVTVELLRN